MSKLFRLACACGALLLLVLAAPAAAAPRAVPPGHSGASQYTETLPSAGGEQPTGEVGSPSPVGGGGGNGGGGSGAAPAPTPTEALGARDAKRLENLGPEGKAAADLAAAAGPTAAAATAEHHPSAAGSSPVKQVVGQLTGTSGSGGMGLLLPLLIAATIAIAVAFVLARRRPTAARD